MLKLTSADSFTIQGVGHVKTFLGVDGLNPRTLVGQPVNIDGEDRIVRRVETHAVMDPTGMNFGLLTDPVAQQPEGGA